MIFLRILLGVKERVQSLLVVLSCFSVIATTCGEDYTVNAHVVNESRKTVEGVNVKVTFEGYQRDKNVVVEKKTDHKGGVVVAGRPIGGHTLASLRVVITKQGYYATLLKDFDHTKTEHKVDVILRKIIKPIPLYVKKVRSKIPTVGKKHGFDFKIGDWVAPHGKGIKSDVYFEASEVVSEAGKHGGRLEISFSKTEEGIVKIDQDSGFMRLSKMWLPHQASKEGYNSELERIEYGYHNQNRDWQCGYFLRVRRQEGKGGKVSFNYVKIKEDISFNMGGGKYIKKEWRKNNPKEYGFVEFTYYFNPAPNDRNLEFDPSRNLFKNLDHDEQVRMP